MELLDQGVIKGFVLLLRTDHLMAVGRADVFNRAVREIHCNWRPRWIAGTRGNPRWAYRWLVWHSGLLLGPFFLDHSFYQPRASHGRRRVNCGEVAAQAATLIGQSFEKIDRARPAAGCPGAD